MTRTVNTSDLALLVTRAVNASDLTVYHDSYFSPETHQFLVPLKLLCFASQAFCGRVYNDLSTLVDNATLANQKLSNDSVYGEVLQHLHACTLFCKIFQGRDELVELQRKVARQ